MFLPQILLLLGLAASAAIAAEVVVVRQDAAALGFVEKIDANTAKTITTSSVKFPFKWPLVEMTVDKRLNETYIITFPSDAAGPVLYLLDGSLNEKYAWRNEEYSFFDLQFSPKQNTLFGIKVTSTYGRTLSNFVADQAGDSVAATELFTLPYMWYVNASSFNAEDSVYYGLINNFPGFDNSTLDQQLVVADFSSYDGTAESIPSSAYTLLPIHASTDDDNDAIQIVQFLAHSPVDSHLYCSGMLYDGEEAPLPFLSMVDSTSGALSARQLAVFLNATSIGPLAVVGQSVDDQGVAHAQLSLFVEFPAKDDNDIGAAGGTVWQQWRCDVTNNPAKTTPEVFCIELTEFSDSEQYATFAAMASMS